ncbi:hypothetical protein PENVUL_c042G02379 [Penicillium vulpinum]|uniref:Uncharacterized protein n=1 Tax=Penicillium vulpinum TaxID=29845 RepID=A0A1V6RJB8_9EURO|nr:hypothetical protein PENVUL_c042G02379 [Penicillium vulpinum]
MVAKHFYLPGEAITSARPIEVETTVDYQGLQILIADQFAIVDPNAIGFQQYGRFLVLLPFVENFFEIYPDDLGNHQRLFDQSGSIIQTKNMGWTVYHTNDPKLSAIAFAESDFFTKKISEAHPLYLIKNQQASVILGDTDIPEQRAAHRSLPPALGPKAVV